MTSTVVLESNASRWVTPSWPAVLAIMLLALLVRSLFFVGYQGRDDRTYIAYAEFVNSDRQLADLDVQTQWVGRVGFWIPLAGSMSLFGNTQIGYAAYSLACSLGGVLLTFGLGRATVGSGPALLAAILLTLMPLDVLYATKAYPDLPVGFLMTLAFWLALKSRDSPRATAVSFTAGIALGLAYLHKETAVFALFPLLMLLRAWSRQYARQLLWCVSALVLVVLAEGAFWMVVQQDPLYRFHAASSSLDRVLQNQRTEIRSGVLPGPRPDDIYRSENSLVDAALMLTTNEEFGVFYWLGLPILLFLSWHRDQRTRDLRIWILALLPLMLFFPVHWPMYTMARDPRYYTCLTIPLLLVMASFLLRLMPVTRSVVLMLVMVTSLGAIWVGKESSRMEPQQTLLRTHAERDEMIWTTPQLAADLLILGGMDSPRGLGVHLLEQGRTAASFQAVELIRPTIKVAETANDIPEGALVLRASSRDRLPTGWTVAERLNPQPSWAIARVQNLLRAVGLPEYATKIAPGGGGSLILCRHVAAGGEL